ncbi:MAG: hypothetical protein WB820_01540, partial [Rhodoplanes sp.]
QCSGEDIVFPVFFGLLRKVSLMLVLQTLAALFTLPANAHPWSPHPCNECQTGKRNILQFAIALSKQTAARGCLRGGICEIAIDIQSMNLIRPNQNRRWALHELRSWRRLLLVVVAGALLVALGLGRFGGSSLYWFLDERDELTRSVTAGQRKPTTPIDAPAPTVAATPLSGDPSAVKQAIDLVRKGKTSEATGIKKSIDDPVAQKVVEWLILRDPSGNAGFGRYAAFIADNPSWPGIRLLRRRAEGRLWQERSDAATVRRFTGGQPVSPKGRFALARVLLAEGDRDSAEHQVRPGLAVGGAVRRR